MVEWYLPGIFIQLTKPSLSPMTANFLVSIIESFCVFWAVENWFKLLVIIIECTVQSCYQPWVTSSTLHEYLLAHYNPCFILFISAQHAFIHPTIFLLRSSSHFHYPPGTHQLLTITILTSRLFYETSPHKPGTAKKDLEYS